MDLFVSCVVLLEAILATEVVIEAELLAVWTRKICGYSVFATG
jgi:hypothetical protein